MKFTSPFCIKNSPSRSLIDHLRMIAQPCAQKWPGRLLWKVENGNCIIFSMVNLWWRSLVSACTNVCKKLILSDASQEANEERNSFHWLEANNSSRHIVPCKITHLPDFIHYTDQQRINVHKSVKVNKLSIKLKLPAAICMTC